MVSEMSYRLVHITPQGHKIIASASTREELRDIAFDRHPSTDIAITQDETMSWVWTSQDVDHYYIQGELQHD